MANKKVKIVLLENNTIEVKVNNENKLSIKADDKEISGIGIYQALDAHFGDVFELERYELTLAGNKRFIMIYNLFNDIISSLKLNDTDYQYDADVKPIVEE